MTIITVNSAALKHELAAWGVPDDYASSFRAKNAIQSNRVALRPFFFNDTEHLTNTRHWLAVNAAFWCCVYSEARSQSAQVEALAGIRALYYVSGALGVGEITAMLQSWWRFTFELHHVPAPNFSAVVTRPVLH